MDIKIDGKTISLKEKLTIGDFRRLGRMPTEADFQDVNKLLEEDWIYNLLELAGWEDINSSTLEDLFMVIQSEDFVQWMGKFFVDSKKLTTAQ